MYSLSLKKQCPTVRLNYLYNFNEVYWYKYVVYDSEEKEKKDKIE